MKRSLVALAEYPIPGKGGSKNAYILDLDSVVFDVAG